jgi:type IV pilus biogenesis protein CpaD/CtpE
MKTDSENRTAWKTVRFTDQEAAEVDQHAAACGLSASELIRRRVLGQRLPKGSAPELNLLAWRELAHLAANVNQLMKHLNEQRAGIGRAIVDLLQVKALVIKVDAAIQKVRLQLLGADTE